MLDVRRMRVLREVAVRGSFSAAAEALSFTQSAISQQIAALEREAGCTLVQRNARGIRLTEAGEALVRHADAILARLSEAEAELEAIAGSARWEAAPGGVRVRRRVADAAGDRGLPRRAPRRRAVADHVRARGLRPAAQERRDRPRARVRFPHPRRGRRDRSASTCSRTRCSSRCRPTTRYAHKRNLRLADLADDPWIAGTTDCECNRLINRACAIAGLRAADRLPDRRLHRDAGLRRGGRRRLADRRARPHEHPRRHRRALARPRDPGARGLRHDRGRRPPHARHPRDARDPRRASRRATRRAARSCSSSASFRHLIEDRTSATG